MKVILKERVANLGQKWDVVVVKPGYARNYLLPQNLAEVATAAGLKKAEGQSAERMKRMEELVANAKGTAKTLSGLGLVFKRKAKEEKLYGSITEKDVADTLAEQHKIEINKSMVKMGEHIKTLGEHKVLIHLTEDVEVELAVKVEAE